MGVEDFVYVGPIRQVQRPALEYNESFVVHDQAQSGFRDVTSFSLPDHFHNSAC